MDLNSCHLSRQNFEVSSRLKKKNSAPLNQNLKQLQFAQLFREEQRVEISDFVTFYTLYLAVRCSKFSFRFCVSLSSNICSQMAPYWDRHHGVFTDHHATKLMSVYSIFTPYILCILQNITQIESYINCVSTNYRFKTIHVGTQESNVASIFKSQFTHQNSPKLFLPTLIL